MLTEIKFKKNMLGYQKIEFLVIILNTNFEERQQRSIFKKK